MLAWGAPPKVVSMVLLLRWIASAAVAVPELSPRQTRGRPFWVLVVTLSQNETVTNGVPVSPAAPAWSPVWIRSSLLASKASEWVALPAIAAGTSSG